MTRTYEGLAGEINTALELCKQLESYVEHWGMAGIRVPGRKLGVKKDALVTLVAELEAMRDDIAPKVPT